MLVGLAGTVLPVLPGITIIFLAMLGYDWSQDFLILGQYFLGTMFILVVLSWVADYFSGLLGAQKFGASTWGKLGLLVGGFTGLIFGGPFGIILGSLIGVILGELLIGKELRQAILCSWGTFVGILAGTITRLVIGAIMIIAFLIRAL
jgi:hypothetical protein